MISYVQEAADSESYVNPFTTFERQHKSQSKGKEEGVEIRHDQRTRLTSISTLRQEGSIHWVVRGLKQISNKQRVS